MAKTGERTYFKEIGQAGMEFTLAKPFSDPANIGSLLSDIAAVLTLLPHPPAKIIDLGCGSGWTSNFYAQTGYDVTGVDISKDAVTAAKKHFIKPGLKLSFKHADYDGLDYKNRFDAAIFFDSLHHAEDETAALRAAYKALKPGGIIVLCEPGTGHSKSPSSVEAVAKYGVNERDMPPKLAKKALRKAGFKQIAIYTYPALQHRIAYKHFNGNKKMFNNFFVRGMAGVALSMFLRRHHGVIVARKTS